MIRINFLPKQHRDSVGLRICVQHFDFHTPPPSHAYAHTETTSAPHRVAQRSGRRSVEFIVLALVVRDAEPFEFLFRVQLQEDLVPLALAARSFCSGLSWRFRWLVAEDIPISHRIADGPHNPRKILFMLGCKNTAARGFREGLKVARPAPFCRSDVVFRTRRRARKRRLSLAFRFLFGPAKISGSSNDDPAITANTGTSASSKRLFVSRKL